ncbi:hypothetical protein MNBD_DELTA01-1887 [hydrothermal vent metagenome]|uniref:DUF2905 domain-containing protein n=1 Tax=hydrothermal vent metagenome TaxID=652676 RepID=A0A3B0QWV7_9ZZZZ
MAATGKFIFIIGIILAAVGLVLIYGPKVPLIGRLPGDVFIKKGNFTFYFPLATSVIISIIVTFILYLISRR